MNYWIELCLVSAIVIVGGAILSWVTNEHVMNCCCYLMLFMLLTDNLKG